MKNRIMIIDDDQDILEELKEIFSTADYEVILLNRPYSTASNVLRHKPDAILLDINMRDISGFEIAASLKFDQRTSSIPVIAMSGYRPLDEKEFLSNFCGIRKFFAKPIDAEDMLDYFGKVLHKDT